jgi:hypothetical protein
MTKIIEDSNPFDGGFPPDDIGEFTESVITRFRGNALPYIYRQTEFMRLRHDDERVEYLKKVYQILLAKANSGDRRLDPENPWPIP